ncbi:zinc-binding dehydrogenase [Streptomyces sp. NBC_01795]|nr:zinc-binding dehydrogenase [Streptomyces sp. NBC_01795]WSB77473.1 zinc-binding dehydrogenase [Streptomyces sp. NBC_01775]WSS43080.1 zinc-binding dehydrogenase [Streptomyces sp. NBC_01187]
MVSVRGMRMGRFGGPGVLEAVELPEPVAGPGEVVIGVSYADVIFMETQVRRGEGFFTPPLPHVPGGAVGGRVVAAGAGVEEAWVGRTVVARTLAPEGVAAGGGYAERARADVAELSALPYALGLREATALAHDGPTAVRIFDNAVSDGSLRPGARVLVLAAAGGLGALLVQLAKAAGAQVIAAARGEHKLALAARKLGADEVVDYSLPDWTDRVLQATGGRGVDVVFDGAGGKRGREALETTARGARFSAHGAPGGGFAEIGPGLAAERGVTLVGIEQVQLTPDEYKPLLDRALFEAAAGRLRPVIGQTFPLTAAPEAHEAVESRAVLGKTLLTVE